MKHYYRRTIIGATVLLMTVAAAALAVIRVAQATDDRVSELRVKNALSEAEYNKLHVSDEQLEQAMKPVHKFTNAWTNWRFPERDAADKIRSDIEAIAQKQLSLVTDSPMTPAPEREIFQGAPLRLQRVTLRASGSLSQLLVWLGSIEEKYPAAAVEVCDFASNVGGNTALTVRIAQPLRDVATPASPAILAKKRPGGPAEVTVQMVKAVEWADYMPAVLKSSVAIAIARNPLQPIARQQRAAEVVRNDGDELGPKIAQVLDVHLKSVIRASDPFIVVDGRSYHIGDEVLVNATRDRMVDGLTVKLKSIEDKTLTFQVSGDSGDHQVAGTATYTLPQFWRAR